MKNSICGANCDQCPSKEVCKGCAETKGCPFGKQCFMANYILTHGMDGYCDFKKSLIDEINALEIPGMGRVSELYPLVGNYVNLEYPLPNGEAVRFLENDQMYFGAQVENLSDENKTTCFGVIGRENFILVSQYGENCSDPQLVAFKRR